MIVTGITADLSEIVTFAERKVIHAKGTIDAERLCTETVDLIRALWIQGFVVSNVFVDNAEQVILNSIRVAVQRAGFPPIVPELNFVVVVLDFLAHRIS